MEKAPGGEGQEPCGRGLSGANRPRATASAGHLLLLRLRPATLVTTRGTHLPRSHKVSYTSLPPVAARCRAARTQARGAPGSQPAFLPRLCAPSSVPPPTPSL